MYKPSLLLAAVLIPFVLLRSFLATEGVAPAQQALIDGVMVTLSILTVTVSVRSLLAPFDAIRQTVAEAVRARSPRSVIFDGDGAHRLLAREVDGLMRILEDRMGDANLGPVKVGGSSVQDFAGTFLGPAADEEQKSASSKAAIVVASEPAPTVLPAPTPADEFEYIPVTEPYRELFISYAEALRSEDVEETPGRFSDFVSELEEARVRLQGEHPGFDVIFFLGEGPELRPRLVRQQADEAHVED